MEVPVPIPSQEELLEANREIFCHASAIPVQNRLRYLVEDNPDSSRYDSIDFIDADEVAFKLGVEEEKIYEVLEELNIPADMMIQDAYGVPMLMPGLEVVLKEELMWREFCEDRDSVTISDLSSYLGVGERSIRTVIESTGIEPIVSDNGTHSYPCEAAYRVRAEWMMFPPARDRSNKKDIEYMTGKRGLWLDPRLDPAFHGVSLDGVITKGFNELADYGGDYMRGDKNRITVYYGEPIVALVVADAKRQQMFEAYGDTIRRTAKRLGRNDNWVKTRTLKADSDVRRGRVSKVEQIQLQAESELQRELPLFSEDEMTLKQVSRYLGAGYAVVEEVCKNIGLQPAKRRTKNNRIAGAYRFEDVLRISRGLCFKYASSMKSLEAKLSLSNLTNEEAHITKINLGRMRKLHKDAIETYSRVRQDVLEVT